MRISAKSDYAVRALVEMATSADGEPVSAEEIGTRQDIPRGFLQVILADLRRAGLVSAQRGSGGGWRLRQPDASIAVADVIRAVDGPLITVADARPEDVEYSGSARHLSQVWVATRRSVRDVLEHVTVADLASGDLPHAVATRAAEEDAWRAR